jgi:crossover junction endodeoxyribonuclease RuvC
VSTTIVGIDPGITGGIAAIHAGKLVAVHAMPTHDGRADGAEIDQILVEIEPDVVYVEKTQPMPKNGSIASFSLGLNTGIVLGCVQANRFPLVQPRPIEWKRKLGLIGKDKNASRGLARELFPDFGERFMRVKDDGLAEAALIARFGFFSEYHATVRAL